ncbi:MAG: chemotaxis protein CheW [Pseudomonadales bacterium]|nr:chemotaxis protein CheW [Pseudomonadales bacterium]
MMIGNDGSDDTEQFLTFIMADEEYGVDILSVQEIRGWEIATPIPNAPTHVKGVINLRGVIVPIIDLRQRFGIASTEYGPLTVVIVLKVSKDNKDNKERVMGIVVDAVSDVYSLSQSMMKDAPDLGEKVATRFLKGLATIEDKMVILLDINELLAIDDMPEMPTVESV